MEKHERFLNKEEIPTDAKIRRALGKDVLPHWTSLFEYLQKAYAIKPDLIYGGKNYGWMYKFRKSSKTLCVIFPEKESFTVVIVFGKSDLENLRPDYEQLTKTTQKVINDTHQYHDGKWVRYSIPLHGNINQVKIMLKAKRMPKVNIE
jgi:hypothetical protein